MYFELNFTECTPRYWLTNLNTNNFRSRTVHRPTPSIRLYSIPLECYALTFPNEKKSYYRKLFNETYFNKTKKQSPDFYHKYKCI